MSNKRKSPLTLFLAIGILSIISGIYFIVKQQYLEGLIGAATGGLLIYLNSKNLKQK